MEPRLRGGRAVRAFAVAVSFAAASSLLVGCVAPPITGPGADVNGDVSTSVPTDASVPGGEGQPDGGEPAADGAAVVSMAGQSFSFELAMCAFDDADVLVHGPGRDDDSGEVAYLDIDLTELDGLYFGEARIELGVTEQFASSDEALAGSVGADHDFVFFTKGLNGFVLDVQLVASHTGQPIGPASFEVHCSE